MGISGRRDLASLTALAIATALLGAAAPGAVMASSANASCTTCPTRVPDAGALAAPPQVIASTATLPMGSCAGAAPLGGVEVRVNLLHSHVGDLRLRLLAPDNTAFSLVGNLQEDSGDFCGGEDIVGSFVGGVAGAAVPTCQVRIPAIGGLVTPLSSLDTLAAAPVAGGTYTLEISDDADAGEGLLRSWQFNVYCEQFGVIFRDEFDD